MSDPPDLNLNDLEELVRDAFHVRDEAVPSDEVVRAQARIVKGCSTVTLQSGYWYLIEGEPPPWRETWKALLVHYIVMYSSIEERRIHGKAARHPPTWQ